MPSACPPQHTSAYAPKYPHKSQGFQVKDCCTWVNTEIMKDAFGRVTKINSRYTPHTSREPEREPVPRAPREHPAHERRAQSHDGRLPACPTPDRPPYTRGPQAGTTGNPCQRPGPQAVPEASAPRTGLPAHPAPATPATQCLQDPRPQGLTSPGGTAPEARRCSGVPPLQAPEAEASKPMDAPAWLLQPQVPISPLELGPQEGTALNPASWPTPSQGDPQGLGLLPQDAPGNHDSRASAHPAAGLLPLQTWALTALYVC